jgi:hypothetical protein
MLNMHNRGIDLLYILYSKAIDISLRIEIVVYISIARSEARSLCRRRIGGRLRVQRDRGVAALPVLVRSAGLGQARLCWARRLG